MPIYTYKCQKCEYCCDRIRPVNAREDYAVCPKCDGEATPQLTVPGRIAFGHHKKLEVCELE